MRTISQSLNAQFTRESSTLGFSPKTPRRGDKAQFCGGHKTRACLSLNLIAWIPGTFIVVIHRVWPPLSRAVLDVLLNGHVSNKEPCNYRERLRLWNLSSENNSRSQLFQLLIIAFYFLHIATNGVESDKSGSYIANNFNFIVYTNGYFICRGIKPEDSDSCVIINYNLIR